jgi:mRNA interferase HigB
VRIIAWSNLAAYAAKHPETLQPLRRWHSTMKHGDWSTTAEVVAAFSGAKTVGRDRIRFEIAGGNYRLIVACAFRHRLVFVKFIGTHDEYDRVDAAIVSLF